MATFLQERTRRDTLFEQTMNEKNKLEETLSLLREKEEIKAAKKKNKELIKAKNTFSDTEWLNHRKNKNSDLKYLFKIAFLTILPVASGLLLKTIKPLNLWIESIGNYQYIIWSLLIIVFFIELFQRAYISDKEKIKSGWIWIIIIFSTKNKREYKLKKIEEFDNIYIQSQMHH